MIEFMTTVVCTSIIGALTFLSYKFPDESVFKFGLLSFIVIVSASGVYALLKTLHSKE